MITAKEAREKTLDININKNNKILMDIQNEIKELISRGKYELLSFANISIDVEETLTQLGYEVNTSIDLIGEQQTIITWY